MGSGSAGLTAAEELPKLGHTVTVFEMLSRPGGTLIYNILRFRLPLNIVDDKVAQLEGMGVEFVIETCLGRGISVDDLFQQGYQAVFLGTGVGIEDELNLPGKDLEEIYQATEFLKYTNLYDANIPPDAKGRSPESRQVVIFGGGCGAVDCARTAVRMVIQEVTCFYRCGVLDMLCRFEDKIAAQEEGVYFVPLVEAASLIGDERGRVVQARCQRMRPSGIVPKAQPIPAEGATYTVDADLVILVPERGPDPLIGDTTPQLQTESEGWLLADKETRQTNRRGAFAAGDNAGQSRLAVVTIVEACKAAAAIHEYLSI